MKEPSETLFCPIRKEWVAALPEEIVRQRLLFYMVEHKGFPSSLISVEQPLKNLPHLSGPDRLQVPNRRADIICFVKRETALHPLLIVECKSVKLMPAMMNQIVGYNHYVRSSFIMMANQEELRTGWFDQTRNDYVFVDFLPSYNELIQK